MQVAMHLLSCMKDSPNITETMMALKKFKDIGYTQLVTMSASFFSRAKDHLTQPMEYPIHYFMTDLQ